MHVRNKGERLEEKVASELQIKCFFFLFQTQQGRKSAASEMALSKQQSQNRYFSVIKNLLGSTARRRLSVNDEDERRSNHIN